MFELPPERPRRPIAADIADLFVLPPARPKIPVATLEPEQRKQKRKSKNISFLREEEIDRLFSAIDSIRDRAIFRLAYHAGLRASEVGKLDLRDYDLKADRIFVHRLKGSHSGHHHLMREEGRTLRAWLKVRGSFPGPIFLSRHKRPIDRTTLHVQPVVALITESPTTWPELLLP